jgi:hypothetical protein
MVKRKEQGETLLLHKLESMPVIANVDYAYDHVSFGRRGRDEGG